ncbi:hypothetical protein FF38_11076, partial [Lucilia cuprina]
MSGSDKDSASEIHCTLLMLYIRLNPRVQFCTDVLVCVQSGICCILERRSRYGTPVYADEL